MRSALQNQAFRMAALLSLALLAGCAAAPTVSVEALRAELAPTGKMRVAVPGNNPNYLNMPAQEPYSGVAVDIGNSIATLPTRLAPRPQGGRHARATVYSSRREASRSASRVGSGRR